MVVLGCRLLCLLDNGPVSQKSLSGFCKPFEELEIISMGYMSPACLLKVLDSCSQCSHGAGKAVMFCTACCLTSLLFLFLQLKPRDSDICHCLDQCPLPEGT